MDWTVTIGSRLCIITALLCYIVQMIIIKPGATVRWQSWLVTDLQLCWRFLCIDGSCVALPSAWGLGIFWAYGFYLFVLDLFLSNVVPDASSLNKLFSYVSHSFVLTLDIIAYLPESGKCASCIKLKAFTSAVWACRLWLWSWYNNWHSSWYSHDRDNFSGWWKDTVESIFSIFITNKQMTLFF